MKRRILKAELISGISWLFVSLGIWLVYPAGASADVIQFDVAATAGQFAPGNWIYEYAVHNAKTSPADIISVTVTKASGATVAKARTPNGSGDRGWTFTSSDTSFNFDHSTPLSLFGQDIGAGETRTFAVTSTSPPTMGSVTAFYGKGAGLPGQLTVQDKQVPGNPPAALNAWSNTPGGGGTFDSATGEWDYGFQLTAIQTTDVAVLDFGPDVDLENIMINTPGWTVLHVGFEPDDPFLPGDRSNPALDGFAILYATQSGSPLRPGQEIDLTLSSSLGPGSVFSPNGDVVLGPTATVVPEPASLMLLGTGVICLAGCLGLRKKVAKS